MVSDGYEWSPSFEIALRLEEYRFHRKSQSFFSPQYFWNYQYIKSGFYFQQLERYTSLFRSSFKIIKFESLMTSPVEVLTDLYEFLGISNLDIPLPFENPSKRSVFPPLTFTARKLTNLMNRFQQVDTKNERDRLLSVTLVNSKPKPMLEKTRKHLETLYDSELAILRNKYGIEF